MQGNEAVARGAIDAGLGFYAGYPITPANEIATVLSAELPRLGRVFIQMEDEIASLAACIGASVGGMKAATATSGPGFSLMQEGIGYAAAAEIPCVVIDVQRAGPSTGRPTAPAQGDVMQSRWGSHGDRPAICLCPSSVLEAYQLTIRAFNLAERYRTPVVLLMDEVVAHMRERVDLPLPQVEVVARTQTSLPPKEYVPYQTEGGDVPQFPPFGEGYRYHITGLFHDRWGFPTRQLDEIGPWLERLFTKVEDHLDDIVQCREESMADADIALVAYGATARSARHALKTAREQGRAVGMIRPLTIWPFPEAEMARLTAGVERVIVCEMNRGQVLREVQRVLCGRVEVVGVNRRDGEMVTPAQIMRAVEA